MKYYKLLKDLPTFNKGDLFCRADVGGLWHCTEPKGHVDVMAYHQNTLEKFPNILEDWFEEIKEPLLKDYPDEMRAIKAYGCSPLRFLRHARKGYSTFNICTRFICFNGLFENLKDGETYTIDELCGEEAPEPLEPSFIDLDERIREKAATEKLYKGKNDMHLREEEE